MVERIPLDLALFRSSLASIQDEVTGAHPAVDSATVVIISKYLTPSDTARLRDQGFGPLGENRAADLADKTDRHDADGWHFVGHLQRNKIARVIPRVSLLHSLDSRRLARSIHQWVEEYGSSPFRCLIEVNIAGEKTKSGLPPAEAEDEVPRWIEEFGNLRICGLMTMAPAIEAEECRPIFRNLRNLADTLRTRLDPESAETFRELSMGMSNDYRVAAEEGATLIRIGRALYR